MHSGLSGHYLDKLSVKSDLPAENMNIVKEMRAEKTALNKKVQKYKGNPYLAKLVRDIEVYRPPKKPKKELGEGDKKIKLHGKLTKISRDMFRETYAKLVAK